MGNHKIDTKIKNLHIYNDLVKLHVKSENISKEEKIRITKLVIDEIIDVLTKIIKEFDYEMKYQELLLIEEHRLYYLNMRTKLLTNELTF